MDTKGMVQRDPNSCHLFSSGPPFREATKRHFIYPQRRQMMSNTNRIFSTLLAERQVNSTTKDIDGLRILQKVQACHPIKTGCLLTSSEEAI